MFDENSFLNSFFHFIKLYINNIDANINKIKMIKKKTLKKFFLKCNKF